ncbi:phage tail protein [Actinocrinis sp.]|uniref:phage tail protein n=1 Tax=Actinocrinis sp. TaxID=1920516 RepID=UPI002DDD5B6A|nr:phage tail protein [Actinocrinis sp.]
MVNLVSAHIDGAVSATAASTAPAAGADFTSRSFGLVMRFAVTFTSADGKDITNLGEWSSCKGLKVEFKTETVKQGGVYDHEVKLPSQVTYSPVILERAMEQQNSQRLQAWLGRLVTNWMNYDESKKYPYPMGHVTIVLQDAHQRPVASWTLDHAYPASWSGPTLDAKGNTVALETLTLEHQGFLPPQPVAAA